VTTPVLLLGTGYTGAVTAARLRRDGRQVVTTSREPRAPDAVRFALEDPSTWDGLPRAGACVWLFPAEPLPLVRDFARTILPRFASVVVIGTTSSYLPEGTGSAVDERTLLDTGSERVKGEDLLRQKGALILRSAGIYGPAVPPRPARNPLDWLRRGLIRDGEKIVNLIHVGDLALVIDAALRSSVAGEDFIVADGHPRAWKEIAAWGNARGFLPGITLPDLGGGGGKRLVTEKLQKMLAPAFAHGDLWRELDRLERGGEER
jgi:nucleoside-diphosphate-sugar epimerase